MATNVTASSQDGSDAATHSEAAKTTILQDPVYEFSAPKFYDFATNSGDLPSTERADAWFDTAATSSKLCKSWQGVCNLLCVAKQFSGTAQP